MLKCDCPRDQNCTLVLLSGHHFHPPAFGPSTLVVKKKIPVEVARRSFEQIHHTLNEKHAYLVSPNERSSVPVATRSRSSNSNSPRRQLVHVTI